MGNFNKHLKLVKEKYTNMERAYKSKDFTVVGDLGIKVIEQLIEADASLDNQHLGDHAPRFEWAKKVLPKKLFWKMRKVWFAYGDLGYEGENGGRAKRTMNFTRDIIEFFQRKWGVKIV